MQQAKRAAHAVDALEAAALALEKLGAALGDGDGGTFSLRGALDVNAIRSRTPPREYCGRKLC